MTLDPVELRDQLDQVDYLVDDGLVTALFLAQATGQPLLLEGEPGVGKTSAAKALAEVLGGPLIRLQCYEGLDVASAVYEWNYARQMLEIRLAEAAGETDRERLSKGIFTEEFLIRRPLLQALDGKPGAAPVLLIDEPGATQTGSYKVQTTTPVVAYQFSPYCCNFTASTGGSVA